MQSNLRLREKATELRLGGQTYKEISKNLGVPESTLSGWLKHIPLDPNRKQELYARRIKQLAEGPNGSRERRRGEIEQIRKAAQNDVSNNLSDETLKLFGAALYWGEGTKRGNLEVTNSDPYLILFMIRWIEIAFGIRAPALKARLNIYEQQNDLEIKQFWSELCGIPLERFGKSYVKPVSKGYKKNNLYYGTIKVTVPKSSNLIHKVFGWTQAVLKGVNVNPDAVLADWDRLKAVERPTNLNYIESTAHSSVGRATPS